MCSRKTINEETGEEEVEEVDLGEPKESEADIAERLLEVEREAHFAAEVRGSARCLGWGGFDANELSVN